MCGAHLKHWDELTGYPVMPASCKSHLKKCLTREVWEEMKDMKDSFGFTFKQAIFAGCKFPHLGMGVFAGSPDTYVAFAKFTDALIESYHGHGKDAKHVVDMDHTHINCPPFPEDEDKMIKSTRMRVARSLVDLPLGAHCTIDERKQVEKLIVSALEEFDGDLKGTYYPLDNMSKEDSDKLEADHFLFHSGKDNTMASGLERDWPSGRGIFHNEAKTFLCWINEEDELRIISMQPGSNIGEVFSRLAIAAAKIEEKANFVKNEHLGYVVSCPTNLGTGLRASVHIHLPKLGKDMKKFQEIATKYHVQIRGAHGEHTSTDDGIFDISNLRRLGRSEAQLVQDMYDGLKQMITAEKAM